MGRSSGIATAALFAATMQVGAAQPATPANPVAPKPAECLVAPRQRSEVVAVVATPVAGEAPGNPAASPVPFAPPAGEPVDAATAAAVTATLREVFACTNAGDFLRVYALFTDDFVRDVFAGTPITPEIKAFLAAPPRPRPLPPDEQRIIVRFGEPRRPAAGRVGVPVVLDEPDDPRVEEPGYAILAPNGNDWRVDEIHEDAGTGATPAAG